MSNVFESAEVVFRYTRRMAISDGVLVDARQGDFATVSREHFPNHHLAMTSARIRVDRARRGDRRRFGVRRHLA